MASDERRDPEAFVRLLQRRLSLFPDEKTIVYGSFFIADVQQPNDCDVAIIHHGSIERTVELRNLIEDCRSDLETSLGVPIHIMILRGEEETALTTLLSRKRKPGNQV